MIVIEIAIFHAAFDEYGYLSLRFSLPVLYTMCPSCIEHVTWCWLLSTSYLDPYRTSTTRPRQTWPASTSTKTHPQT